MALTARFVVFDCAEPAELARFWSQALECPITSMSGLLSTVLPDAGGIDAIYTEHYRAEVPVSSRVHIEFVPVEGTLNAEVDRLIGLGARLIDDRRRVGFDGAGWVIMADPAGNEFRVQSNDAEADRVQSRLCQQTAEDDG
jgi:hypothetical protein